MQSIPTETLKNSSGITWAEFDRDWYLHAYPDIAAQLSNHSFDDVLDHYLRYGRASGFSPNGFFDEAWYRETYPVVAAQVRDGQFASGFRAVQR